MAVLHDNRNMRPDLLNDIPENVDDIFANADAEMAKQRQEQLFAPKKKRIDWRKRMRQTTIITTVVALCFLIVAGVWAAKLAHNTMVSEVQTHVLREVRKMKANIENKEEAELTAEDLFMMEVFEILPEEDIVTIIQNATSVEELISFLQNPDMDFSRFLTSEQKLQLEDALNRYAEYVGTQMQEYEKNMVTESLNTETPTENSANSSELTPGVE